MNHNSTAYNSESGLRKYCLCSQYPPAMPELLLIRAMHTLQDKTSHADRWALPILPPLSINCAISTPSLCSPLYCSRHVSVATNALSALVLTGNAFSGETGALFISWDWTLAELLLITPRLWQEFCTPFTSLNDGHCPVPNKLMTWTLTLSNVAVKNLFWWSPIGFHGCHGR